MMNWIFIAAVILSAGALFLGIEFLKGRGKLSRHLPRAVALLLAAITVFVHLYRQVAVYNVRGADMYSPFGLEIGKTVLALLLIWFTHAAVLVAILSVFFDYKTLQNLAKFFSPAVIALDLVFANVFLVGTFGTEGFDIRFPFLVAELALAAVLSLHAWREDHSLPVKKEWLSFLYALPFAVLAIMPCYIPQALFGFVDPSITLYDFTEHHRLVMYLGVIIPFIIFHALKNKDPEVNRFLMIYLSLSWMFVYLGRWILEEFKAPTCWPLHLCNTAMFLIPLCLVFRMRRLFNFCLFINVIGSLIAMLMPGELSGLNAMGTERISFWVNHYAAFFMPVLLVALKIFKRPKFKEWCWAVVAFAVYFFGIIFVNAWFTNYGEVDFFFVNSDYVADFLSGALGRWATNMRSITFTFHIKDLTFTLYPVYQALFFLFYIAFTVAVWFLYSVLFSWWDAAEDRREREKSYKMMKKELNEYLGGHSITEPIGGDDSPRLVLREFSKKYGSNKHYSVDHVSFEVKGGEIFGFLGPNGAGKSTIIKSIVGIQPLTSGDIEVCGYHVEKQAVQAKLQIGYVPDHYALYENLTGREYINYIADLYQVTKEYRDKTIEKYVERFQLTESFDNQMKTYSHGMKQKITIMAALVHNPKVWVLDEPLTGLDPTSIHEVKECMKEHAAAGNIVFFSSHIIDVVEKICDRIAIIKKGKLRASARVVDLEENGIELEQFYLGTIGAEDEIEEIDGEAEDA